MTTRKWLISALSAAALSAATLSLAHAETVLETISHTPQLSTASKLINESGLAATLAGSGPFTIFVPTDDAFKALPATTLSELSSNKDMLKSVLSYHVIASALPTGSLTSGAQKTLNGNSVSMYWAGQFLTVENAMVTTADIKASNGLVDIVDAVMMPPKK